MRLAVLVFARAWCEAVDKMKSLFKMCTLAWDLQKPMGVGTYEEEEKFSEKKEKKIESGVLNS